ncbi:MAG: 50S ribosomal protein L23 [Candidatus Marinimicrobia bacterium]|jgi:large subunit ribosomal protein L23|nr:50S ribosomal protein L23 [Candidatus Neomarinimicrobiota bacterium]|tara:strand:- start:629 stop:952 length:324 start_codon:yes stop_codon:yes gene_type:complete
MSTDIKKIIIRPLFTEKMSRLENERKYSFQVSPKANKLEIKKGVESLFDVKVDSVSTMNRLGKEKTMTVRSGGKTIRTNGKRSNWKKAIVTLKDGENIDLMEMSTDS